MKYKQKYQELFHWKDFKLKIFLEGILVGLVAGILIVLFRYIIEVLDNLRNVVYKSLQTNGVIPVILWFALLILIGFVISFIVRKEPMARGSGIPDVKGILAGYYKMNSLRVIIAKFTGGVLAIGSGLSLGREGPSIQLGAAVGQGISRLLGRLKIEEKYLITSGASAGLAAAFNAPLAGVIFALEEVHKTFSPAVLMSAVAASLTADLVTQQVFGVKPVFNFHTLPILPFRYLWFVIALGLIMGVFGVFFNKILIKSLNRYDAISFIPKSLVPLIPLMIAGALGFVLPQTLGGGNELINSLTQGNFSIKMLILLLVVKFVFTMISYGSGVPGGIFLPLLVIGALTGDVYGHLLVNYLHTDPLYITNFVVLAMAAYFSAIVKAPITGSILITEMTGSFEHLLALITVSMTAYVVTDILNSKPIYEQLLHRSLSKNPKAEPGNHDPGNKVVIEVDVCLGSKMDGQKIKEIAWPKHCLIVSIRRDDVEIIPNGDTPVIARDTIYALVDEGRIATVKAELLELTGEWCSY